MARSTPQGPTGRTLSRIKKARLPPKTTSSKSQTNTRSSLPYKTPPHNDMYKPSDLKAAGPAYRITLHASLRRAKDLNVELRGRLRQRRTCSRRYQCAITTPITLRLSEASSSHSTHTKTSPKPKAHLQLLGTYEGQTDVEINDNHFHGSEKERVDSSAFMNIGHQEQWVRKSRLGVGDMEGSCLMSCMW